MDKSILRFSFHFCFVDRVHGEGDGPERDEGKGEDDEPAERFDFRQQNDQNKFDRVHQRIQTTLH